MAQDDESVLKRLKYGNTKWIKHSVTHYICPVCGKEFNTMMCSGWGWSIRKHNLKFCTYGCMRRAERLLGIEK